MKEKYISYTNHLFFKDLSASVVVFLVALPLCLGISLVSGAPFFSGIIAGIVGGLVVSAISKSPLGVSGPAAGLAVLVFFFIEDLGSFEAFLLAVVIAGVIQIILGFLGAGAIANYFPSSVINGMLSGIGVLILLKQIPHLFGYDGGSKVDISFFQAEIFNLTNHISYGALIISLVSLFILLLWDSKKLENSILKRLIPAPLFAVSMGVVLNVLFNKYNVLLLKKEQVVSIENISSSYDFFGLFSLPDFSYWQNPTIYFAAITLAIVASIETLLCVEATDKLDPQKRTTPTNLELIAQGIGNIVSGMIGGLPITQVIVRSSANIQSGGQTRMSSFLHGLLLLVSIIFLSKLINLIPIASLASILLIVGYKLFKPTLFKEMYYKGWFHFIPFISTILGIIFSNLLYGILIGLGIALLEVIWNHYRLPFNFCPKSNVDGNKVTIELSETISFINKPSILNALNQLPECSHVTIDASNTKYIHSDVVSAIYSFKERAVLKNIKIEFKNFNFNNNYNPSKLFRMSFNEKSIIGNSKKDLYSQKI